MEVTKHKLITTYSEFIKEMKSSSNESIETDEDNAPIEELEAKTEIELDSEPVGPNEIVQLADIVGTIYSDQVKESKVVLSFEEFVKKK